MDYIVKYYPNKQYRFYQLMAIEANDEWKAASEARDKIIKKHPDSWGFKAKYATKSEIVQIGEEGRYLASPSEYKEDREKYL